MEKWEEWDWEEWEICPKLSHFSAIFLRLSTTFTHFFYTPQNAFSAISHNSPYSPIFPHFPPFSPIFPFFLFIFTSVAGWLIRLRRPPIPVHGVFTSSRTMSGLVLHNTSLVLCCMQGTLQNA